MRLRSILILVLLISAIAAPVVDAIACDDCKDVVPLRDMQQRFTDRANDPDGIILSFDDDRSAQKETGTASDLCPVCANTAAAIVNTCCGAPSMVSHTNHIQKLIAFSDPTYPITKPPQN